MRQACRRRVRGAFARLGVGPQLGLCQHARLRTLRLAVMHPSCNANCAQPTNDLDLATVESLEGFLAGYAGCLLVASHDRAFMAGLDRLFVLQGDGLVRLFEGSYAEARPPPPHAM